MRELFKIEGQHSNACGLIATVVSNHILEHLNDGIYNTKLMGELSNKYQKIFNDASNKQSKTGVSLEGIEVDSILPLIEHNDCSMVEAIIQGREMFPMFGDKALTVALEELKNNQQGGAPVTVLLETNAHFFSLVLHNNQYILFNSNTGNCKSYNDINELINDNSDIQNGMQSDYKLSVIRNKNTNWQHVVASDQRPITSTSAASVGTTQPAAEQQPHRQIKINAVPTYKNIFQKVISFIKNIFISIQNFFSNIFSKNKNEQERELLQATSLGGLNYGGYYSGLKSIASSSGLEYLPPNYISSMSRRHSPR